MICYLNVFFFFNKPFRLKFKKKTSFLKTNYKSLYSCDTDTKYTCNIYS